MTAHSPMLPMRLVAPSAKRATSRREWVLLWPTMTATDGLTFSRITLRPTLLTYTTIITTVLLPICRSSLASEETTVMWPGDAVLLITTMMAGPTSFKSTGTFIRRWTNTTSARVSRTRDWCTGISATATFKMFLQSWDQESQRVFRAVGRLSETMTTMAGWMS